VVAGPGGRKPRGFELGGRRSEKECSLVWSGAADGLGLDGLKEKHAAFIFRHNNDFSQNC
jgi:hypothetical protein